MKYIFILLFSFFSSVIYAQNGAVVGKITDSDNGLPLPGANIILKGTDYGTISDVSGNAVSWSSSGSMGFRGSKKSTPYAAQIATDTAGKKAYDIGLRKLDVLMKGPGSGRESALRALQNIGFIINNIKDVTPLPHNGCRPKKKRRV